jgi:acyl carrier protein
MINRDEFIDQVRRFIEEQTGMASGNIDWTDDLLAEEVLDSLIYVEFLFFLADMAGRELQSDESPTDAINTIEDAFRFVIGGRV